MSRQGTDFDDVKTGGRQSRTSPKDVVDVYAFKEKKWVTLRFVGKVFSYAGYWITGKNKEGKQIKYYVECPSFDPATQERDSTIYDPWRDAEAKLRERSQAQGKDKDKSKENRSPIQFSRSYWINAIDRDAQRKLDLSDNKPTKAERVSGFKDKDSDTLTPMVAVRMPQSLANKIKGLKELNTTTSKSTGEVKSWPVSHEKYGCDVRIQYDSSKSPADQYQVVPRENKAPLTDEERAYLPWDLSNLSSPDGEEETRANFERWATSMGFKVAGKKAPAKDEDEDDSFEDEDDEPVKKKSSKKKKPDPDEDEDDDDFDEDEDDEPVKKSSKKAPTKKSKKPVEEDEDDFEDEDDEDEEDFEEDDEPVKKSSKKAPTKKSKKTVEEDEDDFEDEDEDDEPVKKKSSKKKKPDPDEDEDDFEDDAFDEDEDDEPVKKKSSKKAPAKKSKKPDPDEDDFDEDDDD